MGNYRNVQIFSSLLSYNSPNSKQSGLLISWLFIYLFVLCFSLCSILPRFIVIRVCFFFFFKLNSSRQNLTFRLSSLFPGLCNVGLGCSSLTPSFFHPFIWLTHLRHHRFSEHSSDYPSCLSSRLWYLVEMSYKLKSPLSLLTANSG